MSATRVLIDIIGRDQASPAFDKAALAADRAAKRMGAVNASYAKAAAVGATMTKRLTLPVVALAAASVDTAVKFQKSMTLIQTAGGETVAKTAAIGRGMKRLAVDTGTSLGELESGIYTVAKAGSAKWSAAGQLAVLKAAAQGAKAENVDLGTSVNALTSVMMSYGLGTSKAVQVENELIKGSGLAKVTMEQYAGALSTVVPIASKAGIGFDQVAGAIATLTQHGTTADESTQELAFTIRNLQAPNLVAQKAMQQLGLSVTDVTKHLGRRGLTGTLNLIEGALAKSSKGGSVVVGTFKRAAAATHDLGLMIGHMPKGLADLSRGLLTGKTGIAEYQKEAKSLGGQAGPMGLQFLSLYKSAKGFSDVLKSGSPAQQTAAAQLKAIMGGATGLNTALQLGGESADYFQGAVREVGSAAKSTGGNVLGWAKTQETLAVKWDKMKSSLQVLGLEIGTALIPALSKMVGWVQKGVEWFEHLDTSTKKMIGIGALVVAAIGPVIAIGAKLILLGKGLATVWGWGAAALAAGMNVVRGMTMAEVSVATMDKRSWAAGFRIGEAFRNMSTTARLAGTALGTAGLGMAIGAMTRDSGTATKAIGLLGSTAAGAAMGFSMGGPWGAAIGGLMGGLGDLLGSGGFGGQGKAAKDASAAAAAALAAEQEAAQNLLGVLNGVNGAYGKRTRTATINQLDKSGALELADKAGLDLGKLTDRTLKGTATDYVNSLANTGMLRNLSDDETAKLVAALASVQRGSAKAEAAYERFKKAQSGGVAPAKQLANGYKGLDKALKGTGTSLEYTVKRWSEVNGKWGYHAELVNDDSAKAKRNTELVKEGIKTLQSQATRQAQSGKTIDGVTSAYQKNTTALGNHLVKLGFNRAQVESIIKTYGRMPKSLVTSIALKSSGARTEIKGLRNAIKGIKQGKVPGISVDSKLGRAAIAAFEGRIAAIKQGKIPNLTANATPGASVANILQTTLDAIQQHKIPGLNVNGAAGRAVISEIQAELDRLHDKTVNVNVYRHGDTASATATQADGTRTNVPLKAAGGSIFGPGTSTSDSILARLSTGEHVLTASDVQKAGGQGAIYRMRKMIQGGLLKFASGGAIEHKGKEWIYRGQHYSSRKAAENARRGEYVGKIGTAVSAVGTPYSAPFDLHTTSITRVNSQISAARRQVRADLKDGFITAADAKKARERLDGLAKFAHGQLSKIRVKIVGSDMSAIRSSFKGTADDARQAFSTIFADLTAAGASKSVRAAVSAAEKSITAKMGARDAIAARLGSKASATTAYDKLASAQQNYTDTHDNTAAAVGAFDLTGVSSTYNDKPLTADAIVASKSKAAANAGKFVGILQKLLKEGLDKADVMQLAAAGPTNGMAQALALEKATPAQIKSLTHAQAVLDKAGGMAGKSVADKYEKGGVDSAKAIVAGLLSQQSALNTAIEHVADGMMSTLRHKITGSAHSSSSGHSSGAHPSHGANGGPDKPIHKAKAKADAKGGVHVHGGIHIHKASDPVATANAVTRRLAHLGSG